MAAAEVVKGDNWGAFQMSKLLQQRSVSEESYLEFLRVPTLNCGVYVLAKGAVDQQAPHEEDEVYYVMTGKGMFRVGSGAEATRVDRRRSRG